MQQLNLFTEIARDKITLDLFQAYYDARKNKRNTINALAFEKHLEANLFALASDIIERRYTRASASVLARIKFNIKYWILQKKCTLVV